MNTVAFTGRLGSDPERRATSSGKTVCSFALAVKRPHKADTTDWIEFVVFGQGAEYLCNYARKGDIVAAAGYLTQSSWTDKTGNNRYSHRVVCDGVELPVNRSSASDNKTLAEVPRTAQEEEELFKEELDGFEAMADAELPF